MTALDRASLVAEVLERYQAKVHAPGADVRAVIRDLRAALEVLELEPVPGAPGYAPAWDVGEQLCLCPDGRMRPLREAWRLVYRSPES